MREGKVTTGRGLGVIARSLIDSDVALCSPDKKRLCRANVFIPPNWGSHLCEYRIVSRPQRSALKDACADSQWVLVRGFATLFGC